MVNLPWHVLNAFLRFKRSQPPEFTHQRLEYIPFVLQRGTDQPVFPDSKSASSNKHVKSISPKGRSPRPQPPKTPKPPSLRITQSYRGRNKQRLQDGSLTYTSRLLCFDNPLIGLAKEIIEVSLLLPQEGTQRNLTHGRASVEDSLPRTNQSDACR